MPADGWIDHSKPPRPVVNFWAAFAHAKTAVPTIPCGKIVRAVTRDEIK